MQRKKCLERNTRSRTRNICRYTGRTQLTSFFLGGWPFTILWVKSSKIWEKLESCYIFGINPTYVRWMVTETGISIDQPHPENIEYKICANSLVLIPLCQSLYWDSQRPWTWYNLPFLSHATVTGAKPLQIGIDITGLTATDGWMLVGKSFPKCLFIISLWYSTCVRLKLSCWKCPSLNHYIPMKLALAFT